MFHPNFAGLIGAKEGGSFTGDGVSIEVYLFEDVSRAESLEKSGFSGTPCHRNGRFILMVTEGKNKVLPLFMKF